LRATEIIQINAIQPEAAIIERAAELLRMGDIVVFPTETVYGLGADALQTAALERIFTAKGRPYSDPLIVHIADVGELESIATNIAPIAYQLAQAFWPGPLTLILPADPRIPRMITAGLPTVAVRMPRHPVALALLAALASPIAAPSANRFMHVSPTTAQHAMSDLHGRVPLILDGGPCTVGVESTILDLCSAQPTILRPGGISLEALRTIIPEVQIAAKRTKENLHELEAATPLKSPGQLLIHYAPTVPAFLFAGPAATMRIAMLNEVQRRIARGEQVGVLLADEDVASFQDSGAHCYTLGSTAAPEQIAARLFSGLRTLEEAGVAVILCRDFAEHGLGLAIHDRLLKATGGKVFRG